MPALNLFALGSPRAELDGQAVSVDRSKASALLFYLAVTGIEHSRLHLATLLWPDYDQERAFAYLRRSLWTLNQALGEGWIEAGRDTLGLVKSAWLDVHRFQELVAGLAENHMCPELLPRLEQAAALYQGDFMAGFGLRDSAEFDHWQRFQAEGLQRDLARVLERLAECQMALGQPEAAITTAHRWVALDPLQEAAQRGLMRAYLSAGQRSAALRQYQECERLLQSELGVTPQAETLRLGEQMRSGESPAPATLPLAAGLSSETPAVEPARLASAPAEAPLSGPAPHAPRSIPRQIAPAPPTAFIGRQAELAEVMRLLTGPHCRLLTVQGPGGMGKTRLALQAVTRLADMPEAGLLFPQGIFFVPLAPLSSLDGLVPTLAQALNFSFRSEQDPTAQLLDFLSGRNLLLVLDNFEHLMAGADLVAEILTAAAGVRILATSRERLNLRAEYSFDLHGLSLPPDTPAASPGEMEGSSAVDLFVACARRASSSFELTPQDTPAVIQICRMLEGMPLGIELAAAWVRMLACQEIAAEIEQNLDFLATTQRGVPERHQSLRAAFDHSWRLLDEAERRTFRMLSVFRRPFRLEAAAAVMLDLPQPGAAPRTRQVLSLLSSLVDKSLLYRLETGRYIMHQLLQQYAQEKLAQTPEDWQAAHTRHGLFFAQWLAQTLPRLHSAAQIEALQALEAEIDDIRSAWEWATDQGRWAELEAMAEGLMTFYQLYNRFAEGQEVFQRAAERLGRYGLLERSLDLRALHAFLNAVHGRFALIGADREVGLPAFRAALDELLALESALQASLAHRSSTENESENSFQSFWAQTATIIDLGGWLGGVEVCKRFYVACQQVFVRQQDDWHNALSELFMADFMSFPLENYAATTQHYQAALDTFARLQDRWGMAMALNGMAACAYEIGKYREAIQLSQRSLDLYRQVGDRWRMISALLTLGQVATAQGDYDQARAYYIDGLAMVKETGNRNMLAVYEDCLGYLDFLGGDYEAAERAFQRSLALSREGRGPHGVGMALGNLGDVAFARGDLILARQRFLESIDELRRAEDPWGTTISLKKLGLVTEALGDLPLAHSYFRQALQTVSSLDRTPELLDVLISWSSVLLKDGQAEQAVEILGLAAAHPATALEARQRAKRLLEELQAELPHDLFETARQRWTQADLPAVVEERLRQGA